MLLRIFITLSHTHHNLVGSIKTNLILHYTQVTEVNLLNNEKTKVRIYSNLVTKLNGRSWLNVVTRTREHSGFATNTGTSPSTMNSDRNCRQTPQGVVKESSCNATTATARNFLDPSLTAFTAAVRSAHTVLLNAPFSTLQPEYTILLEPLSSSAQRRAAPTWKLLYGT